MFATGAVFAGVLVCWLPLVLAFSGVSKYRIVAASHSGNERTSENLPAQHVPSTKSRATRLSESTRSPQKTKSPDSTMSPVTWWSTMTPETRVEEDSTGRMKKSTGRIPDSTGSNYKSSRARKPTPSEQTSAARTPEYKREQGATSEPSETAVDATQNPSEEVHLHHTAEDLLACVLLTKGLPENGKAESIPWTTNYPGQTATVKSFQSEVYASRGFIVAEADFTKDQLRNLSQHFNKKSKCSRPNGWWSHTYFRHCCTLQVHVPRGLHVAIKVLEHKGTKIHIEDDTHIWNSFQIYGFHRCESKVIPSYVFVSSSNVVTIAQSLPTDFDTMDNKHHHRFVLQFEAIQSTSLQVRRTAFNRGIVETPLFQEGARISSPQSNFWTRVIVPSGQVIMVDVNTLDMSHHCLELFAENKEERKRLLVKCSDPLYFLKVNPTTLERWLIDSDISVPPAAIYNLSSLHIHFVQVITRGFRLCFSFHNDTALPTRLSYNSWNCSVPYISDFMFHLSCNRVVECRDAADEKDNCSYTTDYCGPGYLPLGGGCFFFVRRDKPSAFWYEASDECEFYGGRPAAIDLTEKLDAAVNSLPCVLRGDTRVYLGVRNVVLDRKSPSFTWREQSGLNFNPCEMKYPFDILCEKFIPVESTEKTEINGTSMWPRNDTAYVRCSLGHFTHQFLECDVKSSCWSDDSSLCRLSQSPVSPFFTCTNLIQRVPYTLVCDHRADCVDESDEDFCTFPPCRSGQFPCGNKQCIQSRKICDGWWDCLDGVDENWCLRGWTLIGDRLSMDGPAIVEVSPDTGQFVLLPINSPDSDQQGPCPHSHFQCPGNGYCLPIFLRCNGLFDCPGLEDEADCDSSCPGFYRCRDSKTCLHYDSVCDGHAHCPQHDDELICHLLCPLSCVCRGHAFFCSSSFTPSDYPPLRFLDASGSGISPESLKDNILLIYLNLADCGISYLSGLSFPNLMSFHVDNNQLSVLNQTLSDGLPHLKELSVAGNPLTLEFECGQTFQLMRKLDLSRVPLPVLNVTMLSAFFNLHVLNLSHSGVQHVVGEGFGVLKKLRIIDVRGCPMTWFPRDMFHGLSHLQAIHSHNFKMCCPALLPLDYNLHNCFAPSDEISSCADLLRGNVYSISVFVLSLLSIAGNAASFIFRTSVSKRERKLGFSNFVSHLSVADFLMGVYLAIIGSADQVYRGTYMWNDVPWRQSILCKFAGFLSLLSSEVSALLVCLITLDRFLVLCFPLSQLHFSPKTAHIVSFVVWVVGALLASVPLLPVASHWEFYSQTGICIPLPITRTQFAGRGYSFAILIVFNFFLFVFISLGQLIIYWCVRTNSMSVSSTTKKSKDITIARRLITVAATDFMCWFPIGVLGLLSSRGVPIPGEVNIVVAIFVLPLNSAINPCLYTLNVILERARRKREEKLRAFLLAQVKARN